MPDFVAASNRLVDAYNSKNFELMRELISPSISMAHHNRNFAVTSRDDLMAAIEAFAASFMRNRRFEPPERVHQLDNLVIRESYWGGTPDVDIPGFGKIAEPLRLKLCSFMRFDANSILVEWIDYG